MKIIHLSFWYPNKKAPIEAIWIKRLICSLPKTTENFVCHFEIKGKKPLALYRYQTGNEMHFILQLPFESWLIFELICFNWLLYQLIVKRIHKKAALINFHIAYPFLSYWHWLKKFVKKPIVICEHWSAYHNNFNVNKPLPRIQRIFRQNIPVFAVSQALLDDIKNFAKADFPGFVIPNVVDENIFYPPKCDKIREPFFFMVSQWKNPKRPLVAMEAFLQFIAINPEYRLIIAGYGNQWDEMNDWVKEKNAQSSIELVGMLESNQIAEYLRTCKAFLHPSDYETFSVVCAEALSCGTPILASNVGGIAEVVGANGILLPENTIHCWTLGLEEIIGFQSHSTPDCKNYSSEAIGKKYFNLLTKVSGEF